jgi:O-antigen ligase
MFDGQMPEVVAAQVIFWLLLPLVLWAPPKWAVVAWLVMGNLDTTGAGEGPASTLGWINAVKGIALPLFLWWRMRGAQSEIISTPPVRLWLSLTTYAAVATFWSPFPFAAAKLVGNMLGIFLTVLAIEKAVRKGLFSSRSLVILVLSSLGLAILQTYYYGGASYGFDGFGQPSRFSSFIAAQQYAAFLVAFLAVILWHHELGFQLKMSLGLGICVALILNGSRTWFLGAALVGAIYLCLAFRRAAVITAFGLAALASLVLLAVNLQPANATVFDDSASRLAATASALVGGNETAHNIGMANLSFRLSVYQGVLNELKAATARQLLLGHGTSSGGTVVMRVFPRSYHEDTLDPNRAIHDEWLRALYEWGIVGLALLVGAFGCLVGGVLGRYRNPTTQHGAIAVFSFLPAFLLAFSTENVLAGAGNAMTMSLAIVIGMLWVDRSRGAKRSYGGG